MRGRTCGRCATRAWRKRHRKTIAARERLRTFSTEQAAARKASAIFFTHLRRTKLAREPCAKCGRSNVVPHWPDLSQPLEVVWFCRAHRALERERLADEAATTTKREAWRTLRERFEAEWPGLPAEIQARLRTEVEGSTVLGSLKANPSKPAVPPAARRRLRPLLHDPRGRLPNGSFFHWMTPGSVSPGTLVTIC